MASTTSGLATIPAAALSLVVALALASSCFAPVFAHSPGRLALYFAAVLLLPRITPAWRAAVPPQRLVTGLAVGSVIAIAASLGARPGVVAFLAAPSPSGSLRPRRRGSREGRAAWIAALFLASTWVLVVRRGRHPLAFVAWCLALYWIGGTVTPAFVQVVIPRYGFPTFFVVYLAPVLLLLLLARPWPPPAPAEMSISPRVVRREGGTTGS